MASPHTTSQPAFLVFPALSAEYTWRVIATETGRTISRHRNLALAYEKAEKLNLRTLESESESRRHPTLDLAMPYPVFATREDFLLSNIRGTCQNWYDNGASDPANGYECNRPASVTDLKSGLSWCVGCYQEQAQ